MRILPRTEDGVKEELLKSSGKFPMFIDTLNHSNIEEWYEHLVAYTHSINKAWKFMAHARQLVEGKHFACAPTLNNEFNGIMKNWIDRIHPISTRQTIIDKFKIDKPLVHPEDFFVPVINYFTNLIFKQRPRSSTV